MHCLHHADGIGPLLRDPRSLRALAPRLPAKSLYESVSHIIFSSSSAHQSRLSLYIAALAKAVDAFNEELDSIVQSIRTYQNFKTQAAA